MEVKTSTSGLKYDGDKPRTDLIFRAMARALTEVSKVGTFGATKYAADNWLGLDRERIRNAGQRHMLARFMGEDNDPETGLSHLAHEAWNKLAELELYLREQESNSN